jgi:hypothetical protein
VFAGTIYASEIHVYKCGSINNPSDVNALITGSSTANRLDPCVQHTGFSAVQFVVAHLCGKRRAEGARRSWCLNGVGSDSIQWAKKILLLQMKLYVSLHDKAGAPASQLPFPNMLSMQSSHRQGRWPLPCIVLNSSKGWLSSKMGTRSVVCFA